MKKVILIIGLFLFGFAGYVHAQIISTIAGSDSSRLGDGGPATVARLNGPRNVTLDVLGNLYIADANLNRIRKVNSSGIISTIAGTGVLGYSGDNGPATAAELNEAVDVAVDNIGNIYIADNYNYRIRKINALGIITTIAGNGTGGYNGDNILATNAELFGPCGVAVDNTGNIYMCDEFNNRIRKVNTSGIITTIAGTGVAGSVGDGGPASAAEINKPYGLQFDASGNLFIADWGNHLIRKINTAGIISTVAGNGTGGYSGDNGAATDAELNPTDIAVDINGGLYIPDPGNNVVRKVEPYGIITTIAGTGVDGFSGDGGPANLAELFNPFGVTVDGSGNVYIADLGNNRVRFITSTLSAKNVANSNGDLLIYPNPNNGNFLIKIVTSTNEDAAVAITNSVGERVKNIEVMTNAPFEVKLCVPDGLYFLTAITTNGLFSQKIILRAESP